MGTAMHTVILLTQDSTYKIALTRFPNVWSATVIVATFALAGYRSPQDSSNELPFRRAMERGNGGGRGLQCVQAIEAAKVALLELPATVGFGGSAYQSSS